jgi:predicted nuclease with RNAse H fold
VGACFVDVAAWVGVDVGGKRKGFDVAVIDERRVLALQSHLTCTQVVDLAMKQRPAVIAIDSPRCCAPGGRTARDGELQLARSICGIRWTPDEKHVRASAYYAWILEGLALFRALAAYDVEVIEVFPTASWTRWHGKRSPRTRAVWTRHGLAALGLGSVPARTNQDQRDAIAAAMTARQHSLDLTETIGGIVVPIGRW